MNQEEYQKRYDELETEYNRVQEEFDIVNNTIADMKKQEEEFQIFIEILETAEDTITEFDDAMWLGLVDYVTVQNKEDILVTFKGGMEIAV